MDFAYNAWADARLVAHLRGIELPPKVGLVLAHLAVANENWLARLGGEDGNAPLWPEIPFEEAIARLAAVDARLLEAREPARRVVYRNSTGAEFDNSVAEIEAHVLNHATYHRGEIAGLLLAVGAEPPIMDLVAYLRIRR